MTVCVAAACDQASIVVIASDRLLTFGPIGGEGLAAKWTWLDDWICLYAGDPSNSKLILEELHFVAEEEGDKKLTRENIQRYFKCAYERRRSKWLTSAVLSPYGINRDQFIEFGLRRFGRSEFSRISQALADTNSYFAEQLLIVGWGKSSHAVMLYELSCDGDRDHALTGFAAIGSGSEVAVSNLVLHCQSRDRGLAETLYSVAAAKFSAERSQDEGVGSGTAMYVTWKRTDSDDKTRPTGVHVQPSDIEELRSVWENWGRPRIPDQAWPVVERVNKNLGLPNTVSLDSLAKRFPVPGSTESERRFCVNAESRAQKNWVTTSSSVTTSGSPLCSGSSPGCGHLLHRVPRRKHDQR